MTCTANACTATQVANSNKAAARSISGTTGSRTYVTCNAGYTGSAWTTCGSNGAFSAVTCGANACTATQVANSNKAAARSISGTTGSRTYVTCNAGYTGSAWTTC